MLFPRTKKMATLEFRKTIAIGEADRLWDLFGFSAPQDLVLEDLALARGVAVTEGPLEKMEARLVRQGTRGLIRVKADIPEIGRRRFAIAHELGHWELHQSISQLLACTEDDMVASYRASVPEAEASYFASGLLMPTKLFAGRTSGTVLSVGVVSDLANHFGASFTAAAMRYVDASPDACALVVSSQGRIKWWRGSKDFEDQFWISAQSVLSSSTVAGSVFKGGRRPIGPEKVDMSAWSERGADEDESVFIEECLFMDRYGQILSLLRLP
jgi:hypothetical protein